MGKSNNLYSFAEDDINIDFLKSTKELFDEIFINHDEDRHLPLGSVVFDEFQVVSALSRTNLTLISGMNGTVGSRRLKIIDEKYSCYITSGMFCHKKATIALLNHANWCDAKLGHSIHKLLNLINAIFFKKNKVLKFNCIPDQSITLDLIAIDMYFQIFSHILLCTEYTYSISSCQKLY